MLLVAEPMLGAEEKAALNEVIDSGWITMGERVAQFERAFTTAHQANDCVAVGSCTAALHLILAAKGIGPGDEVLVPSLSFVATTNSVLYVGATPRFVDIESVDEPHISLADAQRKVTPRTKAVIVMHYGGTLVAAGAWQRFAAANGLMLIEDAAHAAGAEGVARIGDATAFSFYGNKNMTTAEGGVVMATDPDLLARVRQMRGHGLTSGTFQRLSARTPTYDVTMLGFNYRMDELRAALGLVQLRHLAEWNRKRADLAMIYQRSIAERCPAVRVTFAGNKRGHGCSHHIMAVVLPEVVDRQSVVSHLRDADIQTTMHYPPTHLFSFYQSSMPSVRLPVTEDYARREVTLPLHPKMEAGDVHRVVKALAEAVDKALEHAPDNEQAA